MARSRRWSCALALEGRAGHEGRRGGPTFRQAAREHASDPARAADTFAPARISTDVVNKLHADIVAVTRSAAVLEALPRQGFVPMANTPKEFAAYLKDDYAMWEARLKPHAGK